MCNLNHLFQKLRSGGLNKENMAGKIRVSISPAACGEDQLIIEKIAPQHLEILSSLASLNMQSWTHTGKEYDRLLVRFA